jgi:hypothetical protein
MAMDLSPDPEIFVRVKNKWRLKINNVAASPIYLRTLLVGKDLKSFGSDMQSIPDDLLVAAAVSGMTSNIDFIDILDGPYFTKASCICCYAAHSAADARKVAVIIKKFHHFFNVNSYLQSRAYIRMVAAMSRDLRLEELIEVKMYISQLESTTDTIRNINKAKGICITVPLCQPEVLWVYSTPESRKLLRYLTRKIKNPIKIVVASSDPNMMPRIRYRMYAASPINNSIKTLLDMTLEWIQSLSRR